MKIEDRHRLLEEAIEVVRFSDVDLGDEMASEEVDPLKEKVARLLENLNKEIVGFSPQLSVYPLRRKYFKIEEHQLSSEIKERMRNYNFYKIDIPITLKASSDWAFSKLVCNVEFCPDEQNTKQADSLPVIHDIFPADKWQEILNVQNSLILGLDETLTFQAEIGGIQNNLSQSRNETQTKLAFQVEGVMKFAFGPFSYRIRKCQVKSRGRGNFKAWWEFQGTQYVNEQEIKLGVVLIVPKSRKNFPTVIGVLEAQHDFQIWSADILRYQSFFREAIQQFFLGGAKIQATQVWQNITQLA
ncbi:MAG: hypothetical protein F6J87_00045 [Spirulina sp. SIO3F2]|nr:hypothetical protein [Spirulina sp. SIO3F2]